MDKFVGVGKTPFMKKLTYWLILNIGVLMLAVGIYFFQAPNGFAPGGISGVSIILARLLGQAIPQSVLLNAMNVLILIIGVIILGKECGFLTFYCAILYSVESMLLEYFIPLSGPLTDQPLLELIYSVSLTGIGGAIVFKCNASSGGTDIVALILRKYTNLNTGTALLLADLAVAISSIFIYDIKTGLFSLLGLFAKVFLIDDILDSLSMCKAFTIITTKSEEIREYIMTEMKHGATMHKAEGAYSGEEKQVIITVCRHTEALKLRRKVKQIDPQSFIIITKTSEIMGKGFRDA
jgi:uncharacterized membrane-anchored protein YitT (DUF2179 family)